MPPSRHPLTERAPAAIGIHAGAARQSPAERSMHLLGTILTLLTTVLAGFLMGAGSRSRR
jgi:hypothetical protein